MSTTSVMTPDLDARLDVTRRIELDALDDGVGSALWADLPLADGLGARGGSRISNWR